MPHFSYCSLSGSKVEEHGISFFNVYLDFGHNNKIISSNYEEVEISKSYARVKFASTESYADAFQFTSYSKMHQDMKTSCL
jgi:hypothetical protein